MKEQDGKVCIGRRTITNHKPAAVVLLLGKQELNAVAESLGKIYTRY